jgi:hypothetical protein
MRTAGAQQIGGREGPKSSALSVTACLRCRDQKVTAYSINQCAHLLRIALSSLSVDENILSALGAVDSTQLVYTPNLQIAEANGPNGGRYRGRLSVIAMVTTWAMLLSSMLALSLYHTGLQLLGITPRVYILRLVLHSQTPLVLPLTRGIIRWLLALRI